MIELVLKITGDDSNKIRGMLVQSFDIQVFSVHDFMTKICGYKDQGASARKEYKRLTAKGSEFKNEIEASCYRLHFPGQRGPKTPCMTVRGLQRLLIILGSKVAAHFRVLVDSGGIFTRVMAGDQSLIEVINANAASNAPIHKMYRQALAQETVASVVSHRMGPELEEMVNSESISCARNEELCADKPFELEKEICHIRQLHADKHVDFEEEFRQIQQMHAEKKAEREEEIRHIRQLNADKQVSFEDEIRRIQQMRVEKKVEREDELLHISELQKRKRSEYEDNLEYERRMKQVLIDNDYQRNQMWLEMERTKIRLEHDRQMICNPQYRSVYLETERLRLAQLPVAYAVPVPHNAPNQRNA